MEAEGRGWIRPRSGWSPPGRSPGAAIRWLGDIVFLLGLTLALRSVFAALITAAAAVWFHFRVQRDEQRLQALFGDACQEYAARVALWIPRLW